MESISHSRRATKAGYLSGPIVTLSKDIQFDEIGRWSELKLEIVEKYGVAYTTAFARRGRSLRKYYVDAFSGAGVHLSKETGHQIEGSPARALKVRPPFDHFYFIDMNPEKTAYLKLHYYPETDSLYIELKSVPGAETREIAEGLVVDFDAKGDVVGLDIDHASRKLDLSKIETIALPPAAAAE